MTGDGVRGTEGRQMEREDMTGAVDVKRRGASGASTRSPWPCAMTGVPYVILNLGPVSEGSTIAS